MGFSYCLNTSTIRNEGVSVVDAIDIAADAGYEGIEPWVAEIDAWVAKVVRCLRYAIRQRIGGFRLSI